MLSPAKAPREPRDRVRLLVGSGAQRRSPLDRSMASLAESLEPGDLVIVNDAGTMPGSIRADLDGCSLELRLAGPPDGGRVRAVTFGEGDWRMDTDLRPPPPPVARGQVLRLANGTATVTAVDPHHPRLVEVDLGPASWRRIFRLGRPVQYRHLTQPLAVWSVQTVFAGPPWAAEMPSAGRPLSWQILSDLRARRVGVATLTHAAGLSATGDPALDAALPLPERYRIPEKTVAAIEATRRAGKRLLAVGTTVVRALEDSHRRHGCIAAGDGFATLRIGPEHRLAVVDGLLTGIHVPGESHHELLGSFLSPAALRNIHETATHAGYLTHEFGDLVLVWADGRPRLRGCRSRKALSLHRDPHRENHPIARVLEPGAASRELSRDPF